MAVNVRRWWKSVRCGLAVFAGVMVVSGLNTVVADDLPVVLVTAPTGPLEFPASIDKTGTPIEDVPRSIEIIPRALFDEQGATKLSDTLGNVSGVTQGGQFAFGFFDRIIIRGLNATYLNDGLPDSTSDLTGFVHSLTGVERIEILKGPGSAMYGAMEEGGAINLVHYRPSDTPSASITEQAGSFGETVTNASLTGPTGLLDVDWRLDGEFQHSDGFRDLRSQTGEIFPALSWRPDGHDVELRVEYHNLEDRPDASGIPFSPPKGTGKPLDVSLTDTYYTPFAFANQEITRVFLSDAWTVEDGFVINNRFAFSNRGVSLARNAGGSVTLVGSLYELTGRQLREQSDNLDDVIYQIEPTLHLQSGTVKQTLLGGFEIHSITGHTERSTADLPAIANIYNPIVNDGSLGSLVFKCDAAHSCDDADISALFYGLYAIDQIDLTDAWKVRLSGRQNWFQTSGTALTNIPANPGQEQPCNPPQKGTECPWVQGVPVSRTDDPFSWDVGTVYFLWPNLSVFSGYANDTYPIFNTEEPESIGQTPERSKEYEAGLRFQLLPQVTATTSLYQNTRQNVFTVLTDPATGLEEPTTFSYRVKGWETDIDAAPIDKWHVVANFARQIPVITDYPQTPSDVGNRVPSVPSLLANLWTSYDFTVGDPLGTIRASAGVQYRNREYADAGETRIVPGAPLINLGLGIPKENYEFSFGINNLLDRRNFLYAAGTGGGAFPGTGLTVFARLKIKAW
jgi:iron complex outermembrane recepter protein